MHRTVVIKVGGSLLGWKGFPTRLKRDLDVMGTERMVLVVGGGRAADFVRALDSEHGIGEKRAHRLALRALDLTAEVVADLVPGLVVVERTGDLERVWEGRLIPVLAPRWFVLNVDRGSAQPLAESWSVSTDSIAARLAVLLGADELRLLKSATPVGLLNRQEAADAGFVDPAFPAASAPIRVVSVINLRDDPPTTHVLE